MSKYKFVIILCVVLVVLGGISFYTIGNLKTISSNNAVIAPQEITVKSDENGKLTEIFVKPDEPVTSGQAVAEIQISKQNSNSDEINQKLEVSKQKLTDAENSYTKYALMYKDGVVSQEEYDKSLKTLEVAKEDYAKARSSYSSEAKQGLVTKKIYAPQNGTVSINYIKQGENTTKNAPILLIETTTPKITAHFDKKFQNYLQEGAEVSINIPEYEGKTFSGVIENITDENNTNSSVVVIRFKEDVSKYDFHKNNSVSVTLKK